MPVETDCVAACMCLLACVCLHARACMCVTGVTHVHAKGIEKSGGLDIQWGSISAATGDWNLFFAPNDRLGRL